MFRRGATRLTNFDSKFAIERVATRLTGRSRQSKFLHPVKTHFATFSTLHCFFTGCSVVFLLTINMRILSCETHERTTRRHQ